MESDWEEDPDEAREIDAEFVGAQAVRNINLADTRVASRVKVQQTGKSDAKALAVCKKWIVDITKWRVLSSLSRVMQQAQSSYMDILEARYECWKKLQIWVTGMTLNAELNPMARPMRNLPQRAIEPWEAGGGSQRRTVMREKLSEINSRKAISPQNQPDHVEPASKQIADLETTLLDQDTSKYSQDRIHAVLKAFLFNRISLNPVVGEGEADCSEVQGPQHCTSSTNANIPDGANNIGSAHLVA
ncbi:hypothetical protein PSTT_16505 [Puccinia striiformis]|uniref:Uncharacterized protein n=1 Tax=Puccinia striiformis TaxID=27350 RepID=A0A2S4UCN8_9BASI|nr:hypothetical protein PSTT_16505 [Puccinia striiformis]